MSNNTTKTTERENPTVLDDDGPEVRERLNILIRKNAEYERQSTLFSSEREQLDAELMQHPMSVERTFASFGLLLGSLPPATFFARLFFDGGGMRDEGLWVFALLLLVNVGSATAGYFSGKLVGKAVLSLEKQPWWAMLFVMPLLGFMWGVVSGAAGGFLFFVIGAIFGAMIGGAVGAAALPLFSIFHRIFKRGEEMDRKHFLPVAFGITFVICAFILGL